MRISSIEHHAVQVNQGGSWAFVQVHTDDGITGLGEMNPSAPRAACLQAVADMADQLVGRDPCRVEEIFRSLRPEELDRPGVHALSAVEQALWDIRGQAEGVPIYQLLGGACRDQIRLYANISRILVEATPQEFARNARGAVADGFDAVKIAPFANRRFAGDRQGDIRQGIDCARAVREAIGPETELLVDCYGIFGQEEGLRIGRDLEELDLYWLEEPVGEHDVAGYHAVRAAGSMTIAGGERFMLSQGFRQALDERMMDVVMPDATIVGGLGPLFEVAAAAAGQGMQTSPHGPFGPVVVAAHVQAMAAHPDFAILEYAWGQVPWRADLVHPREQVVNGRIAVPAAPGLGCALNMEVVEAHPLVQ